ncbi:MAG: family IA [Candidatus Tokpelaia sp. JSC161]|jgi:HAD superfamily hydrolase (TIGR01509 family)|nr:MAG: family IA [Candidatus Tokpelaia sp. JSC161]
MLKSQLVIFDCDGVLVDSEYISAQINSELLNNAGFPISHQELLKNYAGLVFDDILKAIEQKNNILFPSTLLNASQALFLKQMQTDLFPIVGVRENIQSLKIPYCVCSNSASSSIKNMLRLTNLYDLFKERIFSASEVGSKKAKPAPDVYLYAAHTYKVQPEKVMVLEDSVHGVTAAKKAGMRVIGFTGGRHAWSGISHDLMKAGAETTIRRHADLVTVIEALEKNDD